MSEARHLIDVAKLLESGTWVAEFVKRIARASANEGHDKFAEDIRGFRLILDEEIESFKCDMESALRLAVRHPEVFKDPCRSLTIDSFEDK